MILEGEGCNDFDPKYLELEGIEIQFIIDTFHMHDMKLIFLDHILWVH